jgi:16S rRNA G966 N2-methylase RsmD
MTQLNFDFNSEYEVKEVPQWKPKIIKETPTVADKLFEHQAKMISALTKGIKSAQKKAESINTELSGSWTYKRGQELAHRVKIKEQIELKTVALEKLRNLWEIGEVPVTLQKTKTIGDIDIITQWGYPSPLDGTEYDHYIERRSEQVKKCERLGIFSKEDSKAAAELLTSYMSKELSEEEVRAKELKLAIEDLRGNNIPGFFPTPDKLIDLMFDYANLFTKRGMRILEPSAGIGSIADKIRDIDYDHSVICIERQFSLIKILELKGYETIGEDFLQVNQIGNHIKFDRIIMNPPFEKGQDVEHIMHAYNTFLEEEGILVSVASNGVMSNTQKKYEVFRELVFSHGEFVTLDGPQFKGSDAFRSTGVSTCLIVLRK